MSSAPWTPAQAEKWAAQYCENIDCPKFDYEYKDFLNGLAKAAEFLSESQRGIIASQATSEFDEISASLSSNATTIDGGVAFVEGVRWQHAKDAAQIAELELARHLLSHDVMDLCSQRATLEERIDRLTDELVNAEAKYTLSMDRIAELEASAFKPFDAYYKECEVENGLLYTQIAELEHELYAYKDRHMGILETVNKAVGRANELEALIENAATVYGYVNEDGTWSLNSIPLTRDTHEAKLVNVKELKK